MANKTQKAVTHAPEVADAGKLSVRETCPYCERRGWHAHAIATNDAPVLVFCTNCERWYAVRVYLMATTISAPIKGE